MSPSLSRHAKGSVRSGGGRTFGRGESGRGVRQRVGVLQVVTARATAGYRVAIARGREQSHVASSRRDRNTPGAITVERCAGSCSPTGSIGRPVRPVVRVDLPSGGCGAVSARSPAGLGLVEESFFERISGCRRPSGSPISLCYPPRASLALDRLVDFRAESTWVQPRGRQPGPGPGQLDAPCDLELVSSEGDGADRDAVGERFLRCPHAAVGDRTGSACEQGRVGREGEHPRVGRHLCLLEVERRRGDDDMQPLVRECLKAHRASRSSSWNSDEVVTSTIGSFSASSQAGGSAGGSQSQGPTMRRFSGQSERGYSNGSAVR
jgi:hypothetical protein